MKQLLSIFVLFFIIGSVNAQESMKITIEKEKNGKKIITQKVIDTTGMTQEEKDNIINKINEDIDLKDGGSKKVKILVEDNNDQDLQEFKHKKLPNNSEFNLNFEKMGNDLHSFGKAFPDHFNRISDDVINWTDNKMMRVEDSAPIRSLRVFSNKPETNILNIQFYAPFEGDVIITVNDVKGNKVATKELSEFKGSYTGQIELDKETHGTFFVIVSQGDDGISKRVLL